MKVQKALLFVLVTILSLSLAACGGSSGSSSSTKNAAIEYFESAYSDELSGEIDIIETRDASSLLDGEDDIESPYCIAFEDGEGNAYVTLVFKYEGEWKTEGATRLAIASCDALLGP